MRTKILGAVVLVGFGFFSVQSLLLNTGCSSKASKADEKKAVSSTPSSWPAKMHALAQILSELMPLAVNKTRFNDPANYAKIEANTVSLKELTHSLHNEAPPSDDPSFKLVTGLFEEDVSRALDNLRSGNRDYSRYILKDTTNYCFQCHTQTDNGPSFPSLQLTINTEELNPIDRADFFVSTRQFEKALDVLKTVVLDESLAKEAPFRWEQAIRSALAVHVRVRKNA